MKKSLLFILIAVVLGAPAFAERHAPGYKIYIRDWCYGLCIVVEGEMLGGVAAAFNRAARRNPHITRVWLWSDGGRTDSVLRLHRAIKKRGMDTVTRVCESTCITAFMGGESRVLARDATGLGFAAGDGQNIRRVGYLLKQRGVEKWFVKKMYQARPQGMWYPSSDELLRAGVVTHIVDATGNLRDRAGNITPRDSVAQ